MHTLRWANSFCERGWKVDLITWRKPVSDFAVHQDLTIHYIISPPHSLARYTALFEISRILRKLRPDIIHAHYISTFGILAGLYSRLFGFSPVVMTAWGRYNLANSKRIHRKLIKNALKTADLITCDAEHMAEEMEKLGAARENIRIIYFGTDTQKFKPQPKSEKLLESLGLKNSPVVISVRSLNPIYDIESLIKAIPLVLKEVPEAKFIIAGNGKQKDYLAGLAKDLEVSDSIRFTGLITENQLPFYFNLVDIYVSTSLSDAGLSASTAEAMACGLPPVITDFGDNGEWVEDNVNGFLVPLKNPPELAAKIINLLQDKAKRQRFGEASRNIIDENNSRDKEMGKMEELYIEQIERCQK